MLSLKPPVQISGFRGPTDTLANMVGVAQGDRGERSIFVRSMLEEVVAQIWPKDYLGEILAVNNWVSEKVMYLNDPLHVELVKDPQRLCEEVQSRGHARGDCFPEGTLLWGEGNKFVRIEDVQVGDRIWGLDRWSVVEGKADKGLLSVSVISLSNGTKVSLTEGHKVYVLRCKNGACRCSNPCKEERIRVSELVVGDTLLRPEAIPDGIPFELSRDATGLRVSGICRAVETVPCWDIQTDDHMVYLPEHDVTVSNCDDIAVLIATMCLQLGRQAQFIVAGFGRTGEYSHVFCRVKEPRSDQWIVCDPVAGTSVKEMLSRIKTYQIWSCDERPSHGPVEVK